MDNQDYNKDNQPGYDNKDINSNPTQSQIPDNQQYSAPQPQNVYEKPREQYNHPNIPPQQVFYTQPPKQTSKLADGLGSLFKGIWQIIKYIFFGFSILGNLVLLMIVIMMVAIGYRGYKGGSESFGGLGLDGNSRYSPYTIIDGNNNEKIAVIDVAGVITIETVEALRQQFDIVAADMNVAGVIIRIQSPGGSVVASDELHHMVQNLKEQEDIPVIAFMAGLAASGGYYTAVACDRIIAEPTTITGSIGVIMQTFTMQELFESKLGINAVTVKSGEKKDWPNSFKDITPEQIEYLDTKLIRPAYDRFVDLVDKGRPLLNKQQILPLADGSIYYAQEAMDKGLVDQIGYLEDAVEALAEQADLSNPKVIGYEEVFGFADLLKMKSTQPADIISNGKDLVSEIQSPRLMYLWQIN